MIGQLGGVPLQSMDPITYYRVRESDPGDN